MFASFQRNLPDGTNLVDDADYVKVRLGWGLRYSLKISEWYTSSGIYVWLSTPYFFIFFNLLHVSELVEDKAVFILSLRIFRGT